MLLTPLRIFGSMTFNQCLDSKANLAVVQDWCSRELIGNKGYIALGSATYPAYTWPTDIWNMTLLQIYGLS
jgi:hypothetical protein